MEELEGLYRSRFEVFARVAASVTGDSERARYPHLASAVSWVEFFREPPGTIARRFTFGQLALIAWQLHESSRNASQRAEVAGRDEDLRRMSSEQLSKHLAQIGA